MFGAVLAAFLFAPFGVSAQQSYGGNTPVPSETVPPGAGARPGAGTTPSTAPAVRNNEFRDDAVRRDPVRVDALPPLNGRGGSQTDNRGQTGALPQVHSEPLGGMAARPYEDFASQELKELISKIAIPPQSPTLQGLLIDTLAGAELRYGALGRDGLALRLAVLFKAGQLTEIKAIAEAQKEEERTAVLKAFYALALLGSKEEANACKLSKTVSDAGERLQPQLLGQMLLLDAFCAVRDRRFSPATLAVDLAREQGVSADVGSAVIEALKSGEQLELDEPPILSLQDYAFLRLAEWEGLEKLVEVAEPAALFAMISDTALKPLVQLSAVEEAARRNVVAGDALGAAYEKLKFSANERERPFLTALAGPFNRGLLYQAVLRAEEPQRKMRFMTAFLDAARGAGLYSVAASLLAEEIDAIPVDAKLAGFAETAIEASVASYEFDRAAAWSRASTQYEQWGRRGLLHWLALIEVAGGKLPARYNEAMQAASDHALSGGFSEEVLHRLVTVLDALGYNVPIPLWDAANRTAQPKSGYLPETGVLSRLEAAANKAKQGRDKARTVLLTLAAIGAKGPEGAHMIALGDSIRALKNAGFETQARFVGYEALFPIWPRQAGH